ncbi:MAG TPA: M43 family zinc metalloprotease [Puia sp.]|nr:M43 family zinc metalloprotease [Puia sp.]
MRLFLPLPLLLLISSIAIGQMDCRSTDYKQGLLSRTPSLLTEFSKIEAFTRSRLQHGAGIAVTGGGHGGKETAVITIPVIVHILYHSATENISDAQVLSQIAVLNRDYRKTNADTSAIPQYYSSMSADCGIQFALANLDTIGYPSSGIVRKYTDVQTFDINDRIKSSAKGGDDAWDRDRYLNIWVGNLNTGILGYSSMPGAPKEIDGVVIQYTAFGTQGTAHAPFNLGRTATHEIGHWLNLIHLWGDTDCGDDAVEDTPPQHGANRGTPGGIRVTCGNGPYGDMYMDYMDFTDDIGMHMFTSGQRDRMRTLFAEGGPRYAILSSNGLSSSTVISSQTPPLSSVMDGAPQLSIYPNPAQGPVSVIISEGSRIGSVLEVYNLTGQRMISVRIMRLTFQIDVSSLPGGVYFVGINDGKSNMVKLVKL